MRSSNRQNIPPLTVPSSTLGTGTHSTGRDRVLVGAAIENMWQSLAYGRKYSRSAVVYLFIYLFI